MGESRIQETFNYRVEDEMTPNEIDVLLHCHTCPEPHPRIDAPAVKQALNMLKENGLIEQRDHEYYHTTKKGMAHIEQLCSLPFPVQAWVDFNGNVILLND